MSIAYQVVGSGPFDLVLVHGFVSHLDAAWEEPHLAQFLNRLASFSRLILFDKRGTGLSDPVAEPPTFAERMDDVRAVMDAAGSDRAALMGISEGGPLSIVFACTYPERTLALIAYGSYARWLADEDYPWGRSPEEFASFLADVERRPLPEEGGGLLQTFAVHWRRLVEVVVDFGLISGAFLAA